MSDLYLKLVNWHQNKHCQVIENKPSAESEVMLQRLVQQILEPLQQLGEVTITYGFVSYELNKYIQQHSPSGTCPSLDQHACCETNFKNRTICDRVGAACDVLISGYESQMHRVVQHIVEHLHYDRIYFYGRNRPIHISIAPENSYQLQIMKVSSKGRRYPGKRAYGTNAKTLAAEL